MKTFHITPEASRLFKRYIESNLFARQHAERCGMNDVANNAYEYFIKKLSSKDRDIIRKNNNVFNANLMQAWIKENYNEVYVKDHM